MHTFYRFHYCISGHFLNEKKEKKNTRINFNHPTNEPTKAAATAAAAPVHKREIRTNTYKMYIYTSLELSSQLAFSVLFLRIHFILLAHGRSLLRSVQNSRQQQQQQQSCFEAYFFSLATMFFQFQRNVRKKTKTFFFSLFRSTRSTATINSMYTY